MPAAIRILYVQQRVVTRPAISLYTAGSTMPWIASHAMVDRSSSERSSRARTISEACSGSMPGSATSAS